MSSSQIVLLRGLVICCVALFAVWQLVPVDGICGGSHEEMEQLRVQNQLLKDANKFLEQQNAKLTETVGQMAEQMAGQMTGQKMDQRVDQTVCEPTADYEKYRKRVKTNIQNLWEFAAAIGNSIEETYGYDEQLEQLIKGIYEHKLSLLSDLQQMTEADGYETFRRNEHKLLGELVQRRLHKLQNPNNCTNVNVARCTLNWFECGWGCTINHLAECMSVAVGFDRIFMYDKVIDFKFIYTKDGITTIMAPFSDTCTYEDYAGLEEATWKSNMTKLPKVLTIPDTVKLKAQPRLQYLPSVVPTELLSRLERIEVDPMAWWLGQLKVFLMRYRPEMQEKIDAIEAKLKIVHPIVGIQVRRTDKIGVGEMIFHSIDKYMAHAEEYFDQLNVTGKLEKRRIYLATEDSSVYEEITANYSNYEIITNLEGTKISESRKSRLTLAGLLPIIVDIELLAKCDLVVCTHSSNVGRLVYDLIQTLRHDAEFRVKSLDQRYLQYGSKQETFEVMVPHSAKGIQLAYGQHVTVSHLHNVNGTLYVNGSTSMLVPAFKLHKIPDAVPFQATILK